MPNGFFLITDISGYTAFLTRSELDHAQAILQSLFQSQLDHIRPPFVVSGFRGDAIFIYVPEDNFLQPQTILEAVENLYASFALTREQMQYNTSCPCRACNGIPDLGLKMVVHYGKYLLQQMGDREEFLGADVIVPHRMLKNRVTEETGIEAYALFSHTAAQALDLPVFCHPLIDYTDEYEHLGKLEMLVYDLAAVLEKKMEGQRIAVPIEEAWVTFDTEITAPPALIWDYLTKPSLKVQMVGLEFMRRVDDLGGRVRPETRYHCAHGEVEFWYEVVDWRPFENFTILQKDSQTGLSYYETYYLQPTATGTQFTSSVSKPQGNVPHTLQGMIQKMWDQAYSRIKPFIENAAAAEMDSENELQQPASGKSIEPN